MVRQLADGTDLSGAHVLDLGCGEGKNAAFLANLGCIVEAWDISSAALDNAQAMWPDIPISWNERDATDISAEHRTFDLVIAYGLFHCLSRDLIPSTIANIKRVTAPGGYNIAVCYNDRTHANFDEAHPAFQPTRLPHEIYVRSYSDWEIIAASDEDLTEQHPTNMVDHTHSMTRLLARKIGQ
jgi:cyclopropane fatty-acyl-phospholipid synthase-like methyltransferase